MCVFARVLETETISAATTALSSFFHSMCFFHCSSHCAAAVCLFFFIKFIAHFPFDISTLCLNTLRSVPKHTHTCKTIIICFTFSMWHLSHVETVRFGWACANWISLFRSHRCHYHRLDDDDDAKLAVVAVDVRAIRHSLGPIEYVFQNYLTYDMGYLCFLFSNGHSSNHTHACTGTGTSYTYRFM